MKDAYKTPENNIADSWILECKFLNCLYSEKILLDRILTIRIWSGEMKLRVPRISTHQNSRKICLPTLLSCTGKYCGIQKKKIWTELVRTVYTPDQYYAGWKYVERLVTECRIPKNILYKMYIITDCVT